MTSPIRLKVADMIGGGYGDFWRFQGRYRVVKGSRASKKSVTTARYYILKLLQHKTANLLVVRKTFRTLKDSCYAELKKAARDLQVYDLFKFTESPLEITVRATGQKVYFRGFDDPLKITSVTVDSGSLCWVWIEEAYEITSEEQFNTLDESIRGQVDDDLFKQITITFNPWNERHWLKKRFFDTPSPDVLAKTTNYLCNEFLDASDLKVFEEMKRNNPRRYKTAGLGEWGVVEGLVFENWDIQEFDITKLSKNLKSVFGLDFGYTRDPTALFCGLVDKTEKIIYVYDGIYERGLLNSEIAEKIISLGVSKERIIADSAEPKSIAELKRYGLRRIRSARKGKDSIRNGIQFIQGYKIIIHPRCVNFITEIQNYQWDKDQFDKMMDKPIDDFNHLMDAMRYAMEEINKRGMEVMRT